MAGCRGNEANARCCEQVVFYITVDFSCSKKNTTLCDDTVIVPLNLISGSHSYFSWPINFSFSFYIVLYCSFFMSAVF